MSHIFISKAFNAAMRNIILTESLDRTLEFEIYVGTCMRRPPPTYLDLLVRSNFTSNIRWYMIFLNPIDNLLPSSRNFKATSTFFIYFLVPSCQYVLIWVLSISTASSYVVEIEIPKSIFLLTLMDALMNHPLYAFEGLQYPPCKL